MGADIFRRVGHPAALSRMSFIFRFVPFDGILRPRVMSSLPSEFFMLNKKIVNQI